MQSNILVYGANGAQGGAVVDELLNRGHIPFALVRDTKQAKQFERRGIKVKAADLGDAASLRHALEGISKVFLSLPLGLDHATLQRYGKNAIDAAKSAGVEKLVFNTGTRIPAEKTAVAAFEEKRQLEAYLERSGVPFVSLRPTFYYGNLLGPWTKPGIVNDAVVAYPIPATLKAAWLSWEDAAQFAVCALEQDSLNAHHIDIGGPEALSGEDIAHVFTSVLGREAKYQMVPHNAFEQRLNQALGAVAGKAVTDMYRWMVGREDTDLFDVGPAAMKGVFEVEPVSFKAWTEQQNWNGIGR